MNSHYNLCFKQSTNQNLLLIVEYRPWIMIRHDTRFWIAIPISRQLFPFVSASVLGLQLLRGPLLLILPWGVVSNAGCRRLCPRLYLCYNGNGNFVNVSVNFLRKSDSFYADKPHLWGRMTKWNKMFVFVFAIMLFTRSINDQFAQPSVEQALDTLTVNSAISLKNYKRSSMIMIRWLPFKYQNQLQFSYMFGW